jgi:hypothetical protein
MFVETKTEGEAPANLTAEILLAARNLISDPAKWSTGRHACYAKTLDGEGVSPDDPAAVEFCMIGALRRVAGRSRNFGDAATWLREANGNINVERYNDSCTHAEMLTAFDRAIRACS